MNGAPDPAYLLIAPDQDALGGAARPADGGSEREASTRVQSRDALSATGSHAMTATTTLADRCEPYRRELIGYCYRYFGSYPEAEDAVQETMLRAWRGANSFREDASVRTWLYRIATNTCLDMQRAPQRRALPTDLGAAGHVPADPGDLATGPSDLWLGPIADDHVTGDVADPAARIELRDSVRLAFLSALQALPPRQRVALLLRDVLAFSARECADLLGTSVAGVNSALARARGTVAALDAGAPERAADTEERALLHRYVDAFEAYDVDRLVALLAEDATFTMPPYLLWLRGSEQIARWWRGPGQVCRNSRTIETAANGVPAVGVYHPAAPGRWDPFAVHVIEMIDGRISGLTHFMGADVFAQLGLPPEVTGPASPAIGEAAVER